MKSVILACVVTLAVASPQHRYGLPQDSSEEVAGSQHHYGLPQDSSEEVAGPQHRFGLPQDSSEEVTEFVAPQRTVVRPKVVQPKYVAPQRTVARPKVVQPKYVAPQRAAARPEVFQPEVREFVPILKYEHIHDDDGKHNFEVETGNGIKIAQAGVPEGDDGAVVKAGQYSYTAPDGTLVEVKFVADENGFQPQSDILPVAPAFPHPIPQFVLDQIAFAAEEDAARARAEAAGTRQSKVAVRPSIEAVNRAAPQAVYSAPAVAFGRARYDISSEEED